MEKRFLEFMRILKTGGRISMQKRRMRPKRAVKALAKRGTIEKARIKKAVREVLKKAA
jgi:hypothetical protein